MPSQAEHGGERIAGFYIFCAASRMDARAVKAMMAGLSPEHAMPPITLQQPIAMPPLVAQAAAPLGDAWYFVPEGWAEGAALEFPLTPGALTGCVFASFDMLFESDHFLTGGFALMAGERVVWSSQFSPLTHCQTRIVFRIAGADLAAVDRAAIRVVRKPAPTCRFCVSPLAFTLDEPARLEDPLLPKGPLLDEIGQSTQHAWPNKLPSADALVARLKQKLDDAPNNKLPENMTRWGGWKDRRVDATGFFRTYHDGKRWWLVDPDGHLFWSSGLDCVHPTIDHETIYQTRYMNLRNAIKWMPDPDGPFKAIYHNNPYRGHQHKEINFEEANFIRAFGPDQWHDAWSAVALAELRALGFNTAGDWSDEPACSKAGVPYVIPLDLRMNFPSVCNITGAFPDVFDERIAGDVAVYAKALLPTANDPALIGYFLTNEPSVGWEMFDERRGLAEAMLLKTPSCATRRELSRHLEHRYGNNAGLAAAWKMKVTLEEVADGAWRHPLTDEAQADLTAFSTIILEKLIRLLSDACRKVDPNHLNLGIRWWSFPPTWAIRAMGPCDVVSFNYYLDRVGMITWNKPEPEAGAVEAMAKLNRPAIVGEWHFGSLDGGLPSAGLTRVAGQAERGIAFRGYVENAAALPWCVGVHYFNMHDRNAVYCPASNENCAHGFIDMCHTRHDELCDAARLTHERLYAIASGQLPPYDEKTPQLFPSR